MSRNIVTVIMPMLFLPAIALGQEAEDRPRVTPREQTDFKQQKAAANMRELEDRMFRLSELIRENEPEPAARLDLALETARDDLILEQMRGIRELLLEDDFDQATDQQDEVLRKLQRLRELLLSGDLDLLLQLRRLRMLNAALEQLERIIKEETGLRDQAAEAASDSDKAAAARESQSLKNDQARTREATDLLREDVERIIPPECPAADQLQNGSRQMAGAESRLSENRPDQARPRQDEALRELKKAREELTRQRDQLLQELQDRVRGELIEAVGQMLEKQRSIRESTEALSSHAAAGQQGAMQTVKALAVDERAVVELLDRTLSLVEQTEFSVALPYVLGAIRELMTSVEIDLSAGRAEKPVVATQRRIEEQLAELLETLQQQDELSNRAGDPSRGGCKGCKERAKLLAEIKMIRGMQVRLNSQTSATHDRRPATEPLADALRAAIDALRQRQSDTGDATQGVHDRFCKACAAAGR